jgi:hypothetical protein
MVGKSRFGFEEVDADVLENLGRIEELARAYAQYVGASTMRALCDELKDLLEEVENYE